jgi:putative sigma-54 modulation protein
VADVLDRRIERYKGKFYYRGRGISPRKSAPSTTAVEESVPPGKVVRVKRFAVKPMSVEEATEQMELLGHDFFIFWDTTEDKSNVLYRRRDGDYGLIVPELP